MVDMAVLLEAALMMTGGIVGAAIGTMLGLAIWSRRMNKRYGLTTTTTTPRSHRDSRTNGYRKEPVSTS